MGIYNFSYKNLRRNRWRSLSTIFRIAFGVIIFLTLVGSGIGINTYLGSEQGISGIVSNQSANKSQIVNTTLSNINNTINDIIGQEASHSPIANGIRLIIRNILSLIDLLASIIFLVGVFGVNYAMDMNLTERYKEIALIKSLGFTRKQIMLSFVFEAGLYGLLGALTGTILVMLGTFVLSGIIKIELFTVAMPVWLPLLAVSLTTLFSILLPFYSIWFHSHKDPVEVLRQ